MNTRAIAPDNPPAGDPLIECTNLALGYGSDVVLDNVNLAIPRGLFLPFVGPNGTGKTTLLRAILGMIRPLRGTIRTPFATRPPGYVSQQKTIDPLYPISVLDIALMGAYRQMGWHGRHARAVCRERAERLLADFGLKEHMHKTFDQLSGGMRQKALIARALAGEPEVLVMDEPTTELDHNSQRAVMEILRNAAYSEGRTVLLVHHGLDIVAEMASTVCLIREGQVRLMPVEEARF